MLFMGYYTPLIIYGEEKIVNDSKEAGVNGFNIQDRLNSSFGFIPHCFITQRINLACIPL